MDAEDGLGTYDSDLYDEDAVSCFCDFCGAKCDCGRCLIRRTPLKKRAHWFYFIVLLAVLGLLAGVIYLAVTRNVPTTASNATTSTQKRYRFLAYQRTEFDNLRIG